MDTMSDDDRLKKLYEEAEAQLQHEDRAHSNLDKDSLLHELQVHQVELEMQNEELRGLQKTLQISRDKFLTLFNHAPVGYVVLDENGMIHEVNKTLADMLDLDHSLLISRHLNQFIHLDDQSVFLGRFKTFFKSPLGKSIEVRLVGNNKTLVPVQVTAVKAHNFSLTVGAESEFLLVNIANIRSLKIVEAALIKEKAWAEHIVSKAPNIIVGLGESAEIIIFNDYAETLTGYSAKEVLGKDWVKTFIPEDQRDTMYAVWSDIVQNLRVDHTYENEIIGKNGERRLIRWKNSLLLEEQEFRMVLAMGTDISEQKRQEGLLSLRLQLMEYSFTHSLDELLQKTLAEAETLSGSNISFYHFVDESQKWLTLQMWSERTLQDFCKAEGKGLHYEVSRAGVWADCVRQKKPIVHNNYEALAHRKGLPEGHASVVRELVAPVLRNGKVVAILGVGNKAYDYTKVDIDIMSFLADISWVIIERKEREEELVFAKEKAEESNHLKNAFLANLSHEIRTPMNGILGFIDLISEYDYSQIEKEKFIKMIKSSGKRMVSLIDDLVDIAKIESGTADVSISKMNINSEIKVIAKTFQRELDEVNMSLCLNCPLADEDAEIETDASKLYSVLTNLIKNAIKYAAQGAIDVGYCQEITKQSELLLYVRDEGPGIPADKIDNIFEAFQQLDASYSKPQQGMGLGLSIAKSFVEILGGRIWVESSLNKGSTFWFTLPWK